MNYIDTIGDMLRSGYRTSLPVESYRKRLNTIRYLTDNSIFISSIEHSLLSCNDKKQEHKENVTFDTMNIQTTKIIRFLTIVNIKLKRKVILKLKLEK